MCFSKVKLSRFKFSSLKKNVLFSLFNLSASRLLDTKLMASTQPFKVNAFGGGVGASGWTLIASFHSSFSGADHQHLSGRVGEAAEGKPLQATTSW